MYSTCSILLELSKPNKDAQKRKVLKRRLQRTYKDDIFICSEKSMNEVKDNSYAVRRAWMKSRTIYMQWEEHEWNQGQFTCSTKSIFQVYCNEHDKIKDNLYAVRTACDEVKDNVICSKKIMNKIKVNLYAVRRACNKMKDKCISTWNQYIIGVK